MRHGFQSELVIRRPPGPGEHSQLTRPLVYLSRDGRRFEVPAGMIADGNSGPLKNAENEAPGWLHDWLYRINCPARLTRAQADALFREALVAEGKSLAAAFAQWAGVRALGGSSWHRLRVL